VPRRSTLAIAAVIGAFILAATYIFVLVVERQNALRLVSRHDATWEAAQGLSELVRLEHRLAEFGDPGTNVDEDEIKLRYEILVNRAQVLSAGAVQNLVQHSPEYLATLHSLEEALVSLDPVIGNPRSPTARQRALDVLKPLEGKLAQLASAAHTHGTRQNEEDQQQLIGLHWLFSSLAAGLVILGIVLINLLNRHVRLLGKAHQELHYLAHHDSLTGLANRALFRKQLEQALASLQPQGSLVALLYLDLDHFKYVNDTFGHEAGDTLLMNVAGRLRSCISAPDTVARLGGDEFAVVHFADTPDDCEAVAARISDAVSSPYDLDGHEIVIGTSIGIALASDRCVSPSQLLKHADMALYRAKAEGRSTLRFFEPDMDAQLQARRAIEADLRKALANDEFELFYQPQIDLQENEICGFEALLRWRHPERGLVSPAEFIPIAEDSGLIVPLGTWVLEQACLEAAKWPETIRIAVNLSPVQFRNKNLVQSVHRALTRSGLDPRRVELEVTESVLLQDNDLTIATLHQLRRFGVQIAMDDFGTGYSSLSYLRSFPFNKIKIDQSFVRELSLRGDCLAIVQSIASLGASLGMSTVAEGVETEDQLLQVRAAGCTQAQGYLFGRPKPVQELAYSLSDWSHAATL
jgi:diguanylate cyclase (GGDEF)-like protein